MLLFLCGVALFFSSFYFNMNRADAASSGEIREQINALEEEHAALDAQMGEIEQQLLQNATDMASTVAQKNLIDKQVFLLHEQIENINEQISALRLLIADKQDELDAAVTNYDAVHEKTKERIRIMEEQGELSYWSVLFQANSFMDLLDRVNMIQEIAESDNRRLKELKNAAEAVKMAQEALEAEKAAMEESGRRLEETKEELTQKRTEADILLQTLLAQGESYEQLLEESEQLQEQLMQEIAQMEVAYDEAVYQEWLATYVPPTTVPPTTAPTLPKPETTNPPETSTETQTDPAPNPDGKVWLTPVPYYTLTSVFGMRFHPILNIWRMHNGVDLACAEGTEIYASRGGVVSVASYQENGAGNYVQINHGDGYSSIYMHMTHYIVSAGDYVAAGQVIGFVGSTGLSKGNHLHFGISYNGTYVNPMEYLS